MTTTSMRWDQARHDAEVAARFNAAEARFKPDLAVDDARLAALRRAIGPVDGLRLLDLGCGKGRFAIPFQARGAEVVGVDLASAMLAHATGVHRAQASACRLPFRDATFDAVLAVEVLEHVGDVAPVLLEARRVLRPGGLLAIIDKNALAIDARRPWLPALAIKWIDQKRGLWMYPTGGPVRERWFVPRSLGRRIAQSGFESPRVEYLLSASERRRSLHRLIPPARLMILWSARATGSPRLHPEGAG